MADIELIKPRELPEQANVQATDALMVDNGTIVGKATPEKIVNAGAPVASEAEALAGVNNTKRMTPLRVRQVLDNVNNPAVLRAQAWAESSTPPDPLLPDSKSAKTWASIAEQGTVMVQWSMIASDGQTVLGNDITTGEPIRAFGGVAQISVNGFGPITPEEYSVDSDGVVTLTAPLAEGDVVSGFTQPRLSNSEAQAVVQGVLQQTADDVAACEAILERIDLGALDAAVASAESSAIVAVIAGNDAVSASTEAISLSNYLLAMVDVSWTPAELLDGNLGYISNSISPASGLVWQDSARTNPVTEAGQRVGSVSLLDQSGNNVYASQSNSANRPYIGRYPFGGIRNKLLNSAGKGAVVGTPGTLPSTWGASNVTTQVVAAGTDSDGAPYIDIRMSGSAAQSSAIVQLGGNTNTVAAQNSDNTWSVKISRVGGSATNITYASLQASWRNSAGGFISQATSAVDFKDQTSHEIVSLTGSAPSGTAFALPQIRINASGAFDITLRISEAQVEAGSVRTDWQLTSDTGYNVTEVGKADIWYLMRSDAGQSLNLTIPALGDNVTVARGLSDGPRITQGQTVSGGAYDILGELNERMASFFMLNTALMDWEVTPSVAWLNRSIGASTSLPKVFTGAVSLLDMGFNPTDGDVRPMIAAALAVSPTKEVIIPYTEVPWVSLGTLDINGYTLTFDYDAKIAQNHVAIPGVRVRNGGRMIRPWLTSTLYNAKTMLDVPVGDRTAGYSHWKRGIYVTSDNTEILDIQMLEYMTGGILLENVYGCRVTNITAQYMRSVEGFAAPIDTKGGGNHYITVNSIKDSDRAMEPEDGAKNVTFVPAPGIIERVWSRWYDTPGMATSQSFTISAHSHEGYEATTDIHYQGTWTLIDCLSPIMIENSTADTGKTPTRINVDHAHIINTAAFPVDRATRAQVFLSGHGNKVGVSFADTTGGAPMPFARVQVTDGPDNQIEIFGPDIVAAAPWVDGSETSPRTIVRVTATDLSIQPSAPASPADVHLINLLGENCIVDSPVIHGVQNRGYVRLGNGTYKASGSVVRNPDIVAPSVNPPVAAVRFVNADNAMIQGGSFSDPSNACQLARITSPSSRNTIMGVICDKDSGEIVQVDAGANGNIVSYNRFGSATILDSGTGTVKVGNI